MKKKRKKKSKGEEWVLITVWCIRVAVNCVELAFCSLWSLHKLC
jgi:hypothetical protein